MSDTRYPRVQAEEQFQFEGRTWTVDAHGIASIVQNPNGPDPITGLVPCGCGGVAISEDYFGDDDVESSYRAFVSCEKCELRTPDYPRLFDAKEAWNTAMGYTPPGANSPEIEWISVKDRLPEPWKTVLLWDGDEIVSGYADDVGFLIEHRWGQVFRATHWVLPEPPGGEGEG